MKTGDFNFGVGGLNLHDRQITSSDNQSELLGDLAWALLEEIHQEISPQLEALRASDEDNVVGLVLVGVSAERTQS